MRKVHKRVLLAAVLVLALLLVCGCTSNAPPAPTAGPTVAATAMPEATMAAAGPTAAPDVQANADMLTITVDGKTLTDKGMVREDGEAWLPLEAVAKAMGYSVQKTPATPADGNNEWTLTMQGQATGVVKVVFTLKEMALSDIKISKGESVVTLENPLTMQDNTLYAAEAVFTQTMGAQVTVDAAGGKITVDKGAPNP